MIPTPFLDFSLLFPQFPCSAQTSPCAYPASFLLSSHSRYFIAFFLAFHLFLGFWGISIFLREKKVPLSLRSFSLVGYALFLFYYPTLPYFLFLTLFPLLFALFLRLRERPASVLCFTLLLSLLALGSGFTAFWGTALFFFTSAALTSWHLFKKIVWAYLSAFGIAAIRFLPEAYFSLHHLSFFPSPFPLLNLSRLYLYLFPSAVALPFLWGFFTLLLLRKLPLFSPLLIALALLLLLLGNIPFPAFPLLHAAAAAPFPIDLTFLFLLVEVLFFLYGCWGIALATASPLRSPALRALFSLLFFLPFLSLTRKFALTRDFYFFDDVFAQGIFFTHIRFDRYLLLLLLLTALFSAFRRFSIPALFFLLALQLLLFFPKPSSHPPKLFLRFQNKHYTIVAKNLSLPRFLSPYIHSPSLSFYRNLGFPNVISTEPLPLPKSYAPSQEAGHLYTIPNPLHFPFLATEVLHTEKVEIAGALSTDFFPSREKLLSSRYRGEKRGRGKILYTRKGAEGMRVKLRCPSGCYLHTGLPFEKGFHLKPSYPKFSVNLGFLGIAIPKGEHTLTIRYLPPFLPTGFFLALFTLLTLAIFPLRKQLNSVKQ